MFVHENLLLADLKNASVYSEHVIVFPSKGMFFLVSESMLMLFFIICFCVFLENVLEF